MTKHLLSTLLFAAACGKVQTSAGPVADASLPDALTCTTSQLACGTGCFDPMTSNDHCGVCETACPANQSACMGGHCVDVATMSCAGIKAANNAATNGLYQLLDGTFVYCDMTGGKQYQDLVMGEFDVAQADHTIIGAADLQDATKQAAFIALYNQAGGLRVMNPWSSTNCCLKNDTTAASTMLFLKAADVYPALTNASACSPAGGYVSTSIYQLEITPDTPTKFSANPPLAADFFTTNPATAVTGCGVGANPALFWKVSP